MYEFKTRILYLVLGAVVLLVAGFVSAEWFRYRTARAIAVTTTKAFCYKIATTNFFAEIGRWPVSATELASNSMGLIFLMPPLPMQDGWGRSIAYEPYTTNAGFGRVVSFGRDGKEGGAGPDADIEFQFP